MARGVPGTGRPQLIREYLARNANEAFTAREIAKAVDPEDSVDLFSATLATMASTGKIARLRVGNGRVHYYWPRGMAKPDKRRDRTSGVARARAVPAKPRTAATRTARKTTAAPRSAAAIAKSISAMAKAKREAAPLPDIRTPRRVVTNFPAPLSTVDNSLDPRRAASARIAADIAEFERRGGRIERLGVTKLYHHPDDCED